MLRTSLRRVQIVNNRCTRGRGCVPVMHQSTVSYERKTPLEHILLRPGMYIGQVEVASSSAWTLNEDRTRIIKQDCAYSPGFLKVSSVQLMMYSTVQYRYLPYRRFYSWLIYIPSFKQIEENKLSKAIKRRPGLVIIALANCISKFLNSTMPDLPVAVLVIKLCSASSFSPRDIRHTQIYATKQNLRILFLAWQISWVRRLASFVSLVSIYDLSNTHKYYTYKHTTARS